MSNLDKYFAEQHAVVTGGGSGIGTTAIDLVKRSGGRVIETAGSAEECQRCLELGADDYVVKPFSPRELALRVRAVLRRRTPAAEAGRPLVHGSLRIDPERHRCELEGEEVRLTAKEFDLLRCLMERPGRVMTRDQLLDDVWGTDIAVTTRTIDTHLKRLREKLGRAGESIAARPCRVRRRCPREARGHGNSSARRPMHSAISPFHTTQSWVCTTD